ncbi:MAG: ABC transporter ATP-binding protein [Rhodobiaceae bacterium]|nr:ABC transporter ATP-binding protein [Rhodobiaceae bacterium]
MSLLEIEDLKGGYGEVDILRGIDFTVDKDEIVTLAGTNGSGKSTLVKALMGILPRWTGRVAFEGKDLKKVDAEDRIAVGISYVPQVANVFPSLTVTENLDVMEGVTEREARIAEAFAQFPALADRRRSRASTLSGGERQQLAFARAMMAKPRLMVLDEPTANLSVALVDQILSMVTGLRKAGIAVLLVEQRARQALAISDRGYIMDSGKVVLSGKADDLLADERMAELYLGHQI